MADSEVHDPTADAQVADAQFGAAGADMSPTIALEIKNHLERVGVLGQLADGGTVLTIDVGGRPYDVTVTPGAPRAA